MGNLLDPLTHMAVKVPPSLTDRYRDPLAREHGVHFTGDDTMAATAVRLNRGMRDKRIARPGPGRWVEYILPDLRRVYVEANLRKPYLGTIPDEAITARAWIKPGALEYTNDISTLLFMGMVEVTGDLLDVLRTADIVGLKVQDPETRGREMQALREKKASLAKRSAAGSRLKTTLEPHQERVVDKMLREDQPGLVLAHGVGSGKTLSSIAVQHALKMPSDVVVPAALRANYAKELKKHRTDGPEAKIHSLQGAARGIAKLRHPLLVVDEAHWGRNPGGKTVKALQGSMASKRLLLTGSPAYNHPADVAPLVNLAAGRRVLPEDRAAFERRYVHTRDVKAGLLGRIMGVKPGTTKELNPRHQGELKGILNKWVDYHAGKS